MRETRGIHLSAAVLLLLGVAWSVPAAAAALQRSTPMYLSRAELVRIAGYGEEPLSSVVVTGAVRCYACFLPGSHQLVSYVAGAKVAVACKSEGHGQEIKITWVHATTDEYGEFTVDLPSHLHAIKRLDEDCTARILWLPASSSCQLGSGPNLKAIKPSSVGDGIRVYTTGVIRLYNHRGIRPPHGHCSKIQESQTEEEVW